MQILYMGQIDRCAYGGKSNFSQVVDKMANYFGAFFVEKEGLDKATTATFGGST